LTDQLDRLVEAVRMHARGPETELVPVELQLVFDRLRQDHEDTAERTGIHLVTLPQEPAAY
jgi:hypothetical protein